MDLPRPLPMFAAPCALGKPAPVLGAHRTETHAVVVRAVPAKPPRDARSSRAAPWQTPWIRSRPVCVELLRLPDDAEIAELGARHTKIVATIGPSTASVPGLLQLAAGGMNMARLNMCHGDYDWHRGIIESIRQINLTSPFIIGILVDLGSLDSVRLGEFSRNPVLAKGDTFTITTRHEPTYPPGTSEVSSDEFLSVACVATAPVPGRGWRRGAVAR